MRILNSLIEHTPVLAARRTVKTKWYIINRYNESHNDTMDESAVMLFLCDEQRGNLTEEQRTFAKEKKAEVHSSFSLSVFELILYQVMYSLHLVSGPEDFAAVFSKSKSGETSRQIPPCNGLWGAVCPPWGQGRVPAPPRVFGANLGRIFGGESANEKKAGRKDRRRSAACPPTNARSAGISRVFLRRRSWNFQSAVPPFSPQIRPVP